MTKGHFISYKLVTGTWIRNNDDRCHITQVEGAYKFNMAFYCRLCDETVCRFTVQEEGMLHWKKSVVIRGVYKGKPSSASKRPSRRGRRSAAANTAAIDSIAMEELSSVPETSSKEESQEQLG